MILQSTEVQYDDPEHKYYLGRRIYRSATQIVERFVTPFDTKERSEYMSFRYGRTPEYWKEKWRSGNLISLDRGNLIHGQREDYMYGRGVERINGKDFEVRNRNLYPADVHYYDDLPDGVWPELKLWDHNWGIAGRVDKPTIETIGTARYMHIDDWKTNKAVNMESHFGHKLLGPLEHLDDCEFNHYSLQLSLYQFMGEYFGFRPGNRRIIHYPHEIPGLGIPPPRTITVPYLRDEVKSMLQYLKQEQWLK